MPAQSTDEAYLEELGYKQELKRVLGFFSSFGMQFTAIAVAGGVFLTFGYGLSTVGPLVVVAWVVGGLLQCVTAYSIAEAVSAFPLAGGSYQIVNRLSNVGIGWQVGWMLLMAHIAGLAGESVGLAPAIMGWFGVESLSHNAILLVSAGLIVLALIINIVGVRIAALVNNFGVAAEMTALTIVIIAVIAVAIFGGHNFHPLSYVFSSQGVSTGGILPFLYALLMPAFVISAFDVSGTAGEETHEATRTVPRGMVLANVSAFVMGTIGILLLVLAVTDLNGTIEAAEPITFILDPTIGHFLAKLFEVLAVLSLFVNMVVLQLSAARIMWAQARDGQSPAPGFFTRLNGSLVPVNATIVSAVLAVVFTLWSSLLTVLIAVTAVLWAIAYGILIMIKAKARHDGRMRAGAWVNRYPGLIDGIAIIWAIVLSVVLIRQNWQEVGVGAAATVVVGLLIYYLLIPGSRRGIVPLGSESETHPGPPEAHAAGSGIVVP